MDKTGDASRTRVSATPKTTGRGGQMTVGWNRTHSPRIQHSRRVVKCRAGRRIPEGTVHRRDNQWGIPRKRALFVSDGPDSMTSGSDILEGHNERPPEDGHSDIPNSGRPHDVQSEEELCYPSRQL